MRLQFRHHPMFVLQFKNGTFRHFHDIAFIVSNEHGSIIMIRVAARWESFSDILRLIDETAHFAALASLDCLFIRLLNIPSLAKIGQKHVQIAELQGWIILQFATC